MKLMCSVKRMAAFVCPLAMILLLVSADTFAQTKKGTAAKKPAAAKKESSNAKDKKTSAKATAKGKEKPAAKGSAKKDTKTAAKKETARRDDKRDARQDKKRDTKRDTARGRDKKDAQKDTKDDSRNAKTGKRGRETESRAERTRRAAEQRRIEEERRQAALAEKRRREQAAREAYERKMAFERGLRTETVNNIQNDNTEGEDLQIRRAAVDALGTRAGTVVVMEAQTGKILTMVNQAWAIKEGFKPCSTIKLVTAVGGVSEHVINEQGGIGESVSGMTLNPALARSDNGYFQRVGSRFGSDKMVQYARRLGLGEPTGINAEGETAGRVPNGNNNPRIYSHGDDFEVTPLQLAVMVSALSNGGRKVVPQIPRPRVEKTAFRKQLTEFVGLPAPSIERVLPGMVGAAEYGTARRGVDASMGVAGKTGSCIGKGSWVGLFASVAPIEDPKYAVVVITRGQAERGRYAAAIAGRIYQALRPRIRRDLNKALAKGLVKPVQPADVMTASARDDEDDDEDAAANAPGTRPIIVGNAPPAANKVVRTTQSKPVFPAVVIPVDKRDKEPTPPAQKVRPRIVNE